MKKNILYSVVGAFATHSLLQATWSEPVNLVPDSKIFQNAQFPVVNIDSTGKTVAVWQYYDGTRQRIMASYAENNVWQTPIYLVPFSLLIDHTQPQFVLNSSGNGMAIWQAASSTCVYPQASIFDGSINSWSAPVDLSSCLNNSLSAINPQIAINDNGDAIGIWRTSEDNYANIQAAFFDSTSGQWSAAYTLTQNTGDVIADFPQVQFTNTQGLAIWESGNYYSSDIYYAVWSDSSWSGPVNLTSNSGYYSSSGPVIGSDSSGNVIALWQTSDGITYNIQTAIYSVSTGSWSTPVYLTSNEYGLDAFSPVLAVNAAGYGIASWSQASYTGQFVEAAQYDPINGWSAITTLSSNPYTPDDGSSAVAIDDSNNGVAVWLSYDGTEFNVGSSEFDFSTESWSSQVNIIPDENGNSAYTPQVATNVDESVAIWYRFDGTSYNIQASLNE